MNEEQRARLDPDLLAHTYKHFSVFHLYCCYSRPVRSSRPMNARPLAFIQTRTQLSSLARLLSQTHLTLNCFPSADLVFNSIALSCVQPNQRLVLASSRPVPVFVDVIPNLSYVSLCRCEEGLVRSRAVVGEEEDLAVKDALDA